MPLLAFARSRRLYHAVRLLLAGLFLAAGLVKLARPELLAVTVKALGIVPDALVVPLSWGLPAAEIVVAVLLAFDVGAALAAYAALLALFVAVLAYARIKGLDIDCGCYGPGEPEREAFGSIRKALYRDAAMLLGAGYLFWRRTAIKAKP